MSPETTLDWYFWGGKITYVLKRFAVADLEAPDVIILRDTIQGYLVQSTTSCIQVWIQKSWPKRISVLQKDPRYDFNQLFVRRLLAMLNIHDSGTI
jgi:hypothetical protein